MPQKKRIVKKLSDMNITHIHMTGSPAVPDATFVIMKSMEGTQAPAGFEAIEKEFVFKSVDKVKKQVFGYCLVPDKVDLQDEICSAADIEVACHSLMKNLLQGKADGDGSGIDHVVFKGGFLIESCIDPDGSIAKAHGAVGIPGAWWCGVQVTNDPVWNSIEKGETRGFTVGGLGKRTPITKSEPGDSPESRNLFQRFIAQFQRNINKADGEAESYSEVTAEQDLMRDLWDKLYNLQDALMSIVRDDTVTDKAAPITQSIDQFKTDFMATLQAAQAAKANTDNNGLQKSHKTEGDTDMTTEQVKTLTDTLTTLTKSVNDLSAKITTDPPTDPAKGKPAGDAVTKTKTPEEALNETVNGLKDSVTALTARIEKMEKTPAARRGTSEPATVAKKEGEEEVSEIGKSAKGTSFDFTVAAAPNQ